MKTTHLEYPGPQGRLIREPVSTLAELIDRLEAIGREFEPIYGMPFGIDVVQSDVGRMVVGLGKSDGMLMFVPADEENESIRYSVGDRNAEGDAHFYFGDMSLMSKKYLIPRSNALRAVQDWCENGTLSSAVEWITDLF